MKIANYIVTIYYSARSFVVYVRSYMKINALYLSMGIMIKVTQSADNLLSLYCKPTLYKIISMNQYFSNLQKHIINNFNELQKLIFIEGI